MRKNLWKIIDNLENDFIIDKDKLDDKIGKIKKNLEFKPGLLDIKATIKNKYGIYCNIIFHDVIIFNSNPLLIFIRRFFNFKNKIYIGDVIIEGISAINELEKVREKMNEEYNHKQLNFLK